MLLKFRTGKLALLFVLTLFLGVFSGFSIVLLIPLLQILTPGNEGQTNEIANFLNGLAEKAGIQLNLETILLVYVVLLSIMALLQLWKSLLDAGYQQTFIYQIRRRLFRKIIMADWPLLNNRSKTNHLQVLSTEIPNLADYFFFIMRVLHRTHHDSFLYSLGYAGLTKIYAIYFFCGTCSICSTTKIPV